MLTLRFLFLVCLVARVCGSTFSTNELQVLWEFYNSTNGDYWTPLTHPWDFTEPEPNPCVWTGITCTTKLNVSYVHYFELDNSNIDGTLPASFVNLTYMESLILLNNHLHGTLLQDMDKMKNLSYLDVSENQLSGPLPSSWSKDSALATFNIQRNHLNGSLPKWFLEHPTLVQLNFGFNNFTGNVPFSDSIQINLRTIIGYVNSLNGTISENIGNYPNLQTFMLDTNSLSGSLPTALVSLWKLGTVTLSRNNLVGKIPTGLCNTSVYGVDLSYNEFHGSLPPCLGNLTGLLLFKVAGNDITGSLPYNLTALPQLYSLDVSNNQMTGIIPDLYPLHCQLSYLHTFNNHFSGTLPKSLNYCYQLLEFEMSNNQYHGSLPEFTFWTVYFLEILDVGFNQLSGTLSADLTNLQYLQQLRLEENQFEGELGNHVSKFVKLAIASVSSNFISGTIPANMGYLYPVLCLDLANNLLTGTLPSTFVNLQSLQLLFVSNNMLTGALSNAFDCAVQRKLLYVDVSKNEFTSNLPVGLFSCPALRTFTALSNCFSGPLPTEMCGATNLTSLVLDGLMSATSCQKRFFTNFEAVVSYGLSSRIPDGIPDCLFSMPNLQTLHLSGNGLTGTLPEDLRVSPSLTILSLSHNSLRGSIPTSIRNHVWYELDLSYNKITGTLSSTRFSDDEIFYYYTNLALEVNRLSGVIPAPLKELPKISMLDGNLFQCDADRSDLPTHDPQNQIFSCGSTSFNDSVFFWCAVVGCVLIAGIVVWLWRMQELSDAKMQSFSIGQVWRKTHLWLSIFNKDEVSNIRSFGVFVSGVRSVFVWLTLFIVVILLPTYLALSEYYDTYTHEYAWSVSGAYLSGVTPSVLLFFLLLLFGSCVVVAVFWNFKIDQENHDCGPEVHNKSKKWRRSCWLIGVVLWNMLLVTGVNIAYVYIDRHYSATVVQITQLFVALFKVTWNNVIVQYVLERQSKDQEYESELERLTSDEDLQREEMSVSIRNTDDAVMAPANSTSMKGNREKMIHGISLAVFVMLFNNIAAPFIATGYVSSNCFYDIVTSPKDIAVTYTYAQCSQFLTIGNVTMCYGYNDAFASTVSFPPPYLYSYQCASTFITTYANIFILMLTIDSFFIPLLLWLMKFVHDWLRVTGQGKVLLQMLPGLLRPLDTLSKPQRLFRCDVFIVKLVNMFGILCTFGVILPPVAVICCIASFSVTYHAQIMLGRFAFLTNGITSVGDTSTPETPSGIRNLYNRLDKDCKGAAVMFLSGVHIIVPFAAIFFGMLLFDTLGDAVGWQRALCVPLLLCALPIVLYCWIKSRGSFERFCYDRPTRTVRRSVSKESGLSYTYIQHTPEYTPLFEHEQNESKASSELISEKLGVGLL